MSVGQRPDVRLPKSAQRSHLQGALSNVVRKLSSPWDRSQIVGRSRNARYLAHCSGRSSDGRYCCRVLQRRAHRLFGSAGGQAALGASGRPSPWAGPRVCARGRRGVCAVELVRGRGLQRWGGEEPERMSTAARCMANLEIFDVEKLKNVHMDKVPTWFTSILLRPRY